MLQKQVFSMCVVAAVVTVTAAACSTSGTTGTTGPAPAGAAAGSASGSAPASGGDSTQAMALLAEMTAPQAVAASTKAVASKQSAKIHMSMTSPAFSETADGALSFGQPIAMDMTVTMSSSNPQASPVFSQLGKMEMRMSGLVAYLDMGNSRQVVAAMQGKQWMKIDFGDPNGVPGLSSFSFMKDMPKNNDPSKQLDSLLAAPNLKKLGQEQRNGVQTLHFAGTLAPDDVVKAGAGTWLTQQDRDSIKATMKQAGVTLTSYDLWVDADGLPAELKFTEDTKAGPVSFDAVYSDWGTPVSVTAPPADQTADIAQLLKTQRG